MLEKYRENFESLTDTEAAHVAGAMMPHYPGIVSHLASIVDEDGTCEIDGSVLYGACCDCGVDIDQADVVMSMADDATAVGVVCLEKLIGKPIQRERRETRTGIRRKTTRRSVTPASRDDPRVIRQVQPNPKKKGSASWDRYALYQEGMTVTQALAAGLKRADINWDAERGFITLEAE